MPVCLSVCLSVCVSPLKWQLVTKMAVGLFKHTQLPAQFSNTPNTRMPPPRCPWATRLIHACWAESVLEGANLTHLPAQSPCQTHAIGVRVPSSRCAAARQEPTQPPVILPTMPVRPSVCLSLLKWLFAFSPAHLKHAQHMQAAPHAALEGHANTREHTRAPTLALR